MIAFLIGGEGRFMDAMINKLNKDGHRVYLLTGTKNSHTSYQKVFEKYNFEYDGFGRKIKVIINDHPYCEITYDDKNKTKSTKYATNQGFKSTTNINDELVQIEYIDENNHPHTYLTQAYDEDGKIIKKQEFDNDLCYNTYTYSCFFIHFFHL